MIHGKEKSEISKCVFLALTANSLVHSCIKHSNAHFVLPCVVIFVFSFIFQVHISECSSVADHCSTYALNDSAQSHFRTPCSHAHVQKCAQCENLSDVLHDIESHLSQPKLPPDEREDQLYVYAQAAQAIKSWKAHQLRTVRQDTARTQCLEALDDNSVLITQDWAMKFIPLKYRESQSDWFGKRGISWHICVAARKLDGKFQSQSFVHIVKNCSQDSSAVVRIIEHTLRSLKKEHPEIVSAYLRQDNAGCYHNSAVLASCSLMEEKTGISVRRVDFSDPQGGKGACDRKAATIKAHVRRCVNEGHDVQNSCEFDQAMLSNGGIAGVRVALVDAGRECVLPQVKWYAVSRLNDFKYSDEGVTVWRAFDVGKGKLLSHTQARGNTY